MLSKYLNKIMHYQDLSTEEMQNALHLITSSEIPYAQMAAFLVALRMKGESATELVGAARVLRRAANFIDCGQREVVDIVGTGGDGANTFNISTTSAFVAAGAGVNIAKHGNRASSSKCGSADVLEALGYNLQAEIPRIEYAIKQYGIGFLYAPKMHPILARVSGVRRELKIRTIFNMLGPLCNPAGAKAMVVGVYAPELTELFAETLQQLGVRHALVVHGMDGIDEISCCAPTRVSELKNGLIKTSEWLPELLLEQTYCPKDIHGGTPEVNAKILRNILENRAHGAQRAAVILNAGAVIYVSGLAENLREGMVLAEKSISTGEALKKLETLLEVSHGKSA